jgi:hypothetical protein
MKLAATPIITIERPSPNTSAAGCWRAAPATARTLSSDIDTSATTICQAACTSVFGAGLAPPAAHVDAACLDLPSSRHIFQQRDATREQQTDDFQKLDSESRKHDPQHRRGKNPDQDCSPALFRHQAGRCKPDDDRIVAREHEVDHHHLKQRRESVGGCENQA